MRKIVMDLAVSLDSLIEGPQGEYDWCIMEPEMDFGGFLERVDTLFFGRKSYELFGSQDPETLPEMERDLLRMIRSKECFVFSNTLEAPPAGASLIRGDWEPQVRRLKELPGKDIWLFGGAGLLSGFLRADLVDELRLSVHPLLLGSGKPLFTPLERRFPLRLASCRTFPSGVVGLVYERIAER